MDKPAVLERGLPIDHRAHERVAEPELWPGVEEARRGRWSYRSGGDRKPFSGGRDQGWISNRLRRRHQQEPSAVIRERRQAAAEALLDPSRDRCGVGQPEAARECCECPRSRQLQQREGIAMGLGHDPIADRRVQPAGDDRRQERTSVGDTERPDRQLRQTGQIRVLGRLANPEQDDH